MRELSKFFLLILYYPMFLVLDLQSQCMGSRGGQKKHWQLRGKQDNLDHNDYHDLYVK